jgi:hydroxypyruvate isomerase
MNRMPKLAANLSLMFNEVDFLDRFDAAAKAGFRGVEYLFPYAYDKDQIVERLRRNGLVQVLHNLPAGDFAAGERGIACYADRVGEFQDGVGRAIEYATALGCKQVNCLAGILRGDRETATKTLIDNLKFAARTLAMAGIRLLVEPINTRDIPDFYLCHSAQAVTIINEVDSTNLYLQYDIYHMQIMEGDLSHTIAKFLARIGHFQLADNPGRHEPGTGEINYPFLFQFLDRLGYKGWVGCEYNPLSTTLEGLGWARSHL